VTQYAGMCVVNNEGIRDKICVKDGTTAAAEVHIMHFAYSLAITET
jgi:hypothetical protein